MSIRGEVLVAIMNEPRDLAIAREQHWYRIPVRSVKRLLSVGANGMSQRAFT
ncbi:MAG: hypothetical protein ACPGWR_33465 [Ardenticatenaceae bacterium]